MVGEWMKILFLADNFYPEVNAAASRVYERACYWAKWGHEVTVLTSVPNFPEGKVYSGYKNKFYQVEIIDGIRVVRVKTFIAKNTGFLFRIIDFISYFFAAIIASFWQTRPDVVVATSPQFFAGLAGLVVAKFKRRPFVLELADLWPDSIVAVGAMRENFIITMLTKLEYFLYRHCAHIITLTQAFEKKIAEHGIGVNKITTIINGVELNNFYPCAKDKTLLDHYQLQDKFIVGYIGTMGMAHQLECVVEAAKLLSDTNIHFIFVGTGADQDKLMRLTTELALINITFIPKQPKSKIVDYWSLCDLALVHLKNNQVFAEVIPSKIFEAMAMAIPILLASPAGEASTLLSQLAIGRWIESGNPLTLAKEITIMSQDKQLLKKYAEQAVKQSVSFSREKQSVTFIQVLQQQLT